MSNKKTAPVETELDHDGFNPTPTNGELTAELGNPFREELQVNTALEIDPSILDIERVVDAHLAKYPAITVQVDPLTGALSPVPAKAFELDATGTSTKAVSVTVEGTATLEPPQDSQAGTEPLNPVTPIRESARGTGAGYFEPDEAARAAKPVDPVGKALQRAAAHEQPAEPVMDKAAADKLAADVLQIAETEPDRLPAAEEIDIPEHDNFANLRAAVDKLHAAQQALRDDGPDKGSAKT